MHDFPLMARYNAWANDRLYGCVAGLDDAAYRRDRGLFFGSIHNTLNHLLAVDRLWTGRMVGADRGVKSLDQILHDDRAELAEVRKDEDAQFIALVDRLDEDGLNRRAPYRRMVGNGDHSAPVRHMLITLLNHQTHHRGQITAALTQDGVTPPALDVVDFLDELGETDA